MTWVEICEQVLCALALVIGMTMAVSLIFLLADVRKYFLRRRIEKMRRLCGPCVHLHFSRYDGYACEAHYSGNCTPEKQECYYPDDY